MNNSQLLRYFIENTLSVTSVRLVTEIIGFYDTLGTLLSTSEHEIDAFVKYTHAANSSRPLHGNILIPNKDSQAIKFFPF